jgi:hypothetical protein
MRGFLRKFNWPWDSRRLPSPEIRYANFGARCTEFAAQLKTK